MLSFIIGGRDTTPQLLLKGGNCIGYNSVCYRLLLSCRWCLNKNRIDLEHLLNAHCCTSSHLCFSEYLAVLLPLLPICLSFPHSSLIPLPPAHSEVCIPVPSRVQSECHIALLYYLDVSVYSCLGLHFEDNPKIDKASGCISVQFTPIH